MEQLAIEVKFGNMHVGFPVLEEEAIHVLRVLHREGIEASIHILEGDPIEIPTWSWHTFFKEYDQLIGKRSSEREYLLQTYHKLCDIFGVGSRLWDDLYHSYSRNVFCSGNRLSIVGEYLTWLWFVEEAKKYNIPYYQGIDTFLDEYRNAVSQCVNLDID